MLARLRAAIEAGYACMALQRLPHITLLDADYYHAKLKPILAEWVFLWLTAQHVHGIDAGDAIEYLLEGAVARSEATTKLRLIEAELARVEADLGAAPLEPPLSDDHVAALPPGEGEQRRATARARSCASAPRRSRATARASRCSRRSAARSRRARRRGASSARA